MANEKKPFVDLNKLTDEKFLDWLFDLPKFNREFFEQATREEIRKYNAQYLYFAVMFLFCAGITLPINWLFKLGYDDTKLLLLAAFAARSYWTNPLLVPNLWRALKLKVRHWINMRGH